MQGIITKIVSNHYQVTSNNQKYDCIARGKVRLQGKPLVGDYVIFEEFDNKFGIEEFLERKNILKRPAIANVDQVLIVCSAIEPDFSPILTDRLSFLINYEKLPACLVITKLDLVDGNHQIYKIMEDYRRCGFTVVDAFDKEGMLKLLANKVSVLTGQSGVGKSTCLNRLNPDFNLVTQGISKALNRGKHTTRFTCLYQVGEGYVADTPGFSALNWDKMDITRFSTTPFDWQNYYGKCYYNDCIHHNEPDCEIKRQVELGNILKSRYDNYVECLNFIKAGKKQ